GKWRLNVLELRDIAPDGLQVRSPVRQRALHQMADEVLRKLHDVIQRRVSYFRFHHPELGEMPARFGFFRAEGRTERINLAQRHRRSFDVELAGLSKKRLFVEVIHRKQGAGAFAGCGCENGRVGKSEAALVEEIAGGANDLSSNPQDGALPRRAHPQVPVLHKKIDPMLLARDGKRIVFGHPLDYPDIADVEFITAGGTLIGAHLTRDHQARFVGQVLECLKDFRRYLVLGDHTLNHAGSVAKDGEDQLAAFTLVVKP